MTAVLRERLDERLDLPWLAHEVSFRSLVPLVIGGLRASDQMKITRNALTKLDRLMRPPKRDLPMWLSPRLVSIGVQAGLVIRRELRRRAKAPGRLDLTGAIATDLLADLGMDRAVHSIAAVLTAIAGPPGAAAANVMYALVTRPDRADRLGAEFAAVTPDELYRTGTRCAPVAHRCPTPRTASPAPSTTCRSAGHRRRASVPGSAPSNWCCCAGCSARSSGSRPPTRRRCGWPSARWRYRWASPDG
jgi:hypothetical protein